MIGRIRGTLLEKQAPLLLIDVQGVGYEIQVSLNTFFELPEIDQLVCLYTHFVVREDAQHLYGFGDDSERLLFRELIKISGVGPKLALAILSGMTTQEFVRCVHGNDSATLVRLPGVGKKTAERLLIEMRDRLDNWAGAADAGRATSASGMGGNNVVQEAESGLIALGYKPQEAQRMISAQVTDKDKLPASEELIRLALKSVVKK
ncbi:MAG: Holliday junction branch migration protein RuvA [Gammaproteobacteria bacterium]|nr:MAG: Holliday junction branch migration protein RuvA [Gammaproteobacteria bacterium]RLA54059.1 MAG: Holliday junction branch migration protein RuvA [Gammaproteobacteria bacterium]